LTLELRSETFLGVEKKAEKLKRKGGTQMEALFWKKKKKVAVYKGSHGDREVRKCLHKALKPQMAQAPKKRSSRAEDVGKRRN